MTPRRPLPASLTVLLTVGALIASTAGAAGAAIRVTSTKIKPGLVYKKIVNTQGPKVSHLVVLNPASARTFDVATPGCCFPGYTKPSTYGQNSGALVAINGDFSQRGGPVHPFAEDSDLKTLGLQIDTNFAIRADETAAFLDTPVPRVFMKIKSSADPAIDGQRWRITHWNSDKPKLKQFAGYTSVGGSVEKPPKNACSIRFSKTGGATWATGQSGVQRRYVASAEEVCSSSAMSPPSGTDIVLSAIRDTARATELKQLSKGDKVTITWSLGWPGVLDSIGGYPRLLAGGTVVAPSSCGSYFCNRNPRTAIGLTADGKILLMVVDGRQAGYSVGMRLDELAKELKRRGAVEALNLDGGGGAVMWIRGMGIVSSPSPSAGERLASSIVLVHRREDPNEIAPTTTRTSSPLAANPLLNSPLMPGGAGTYSTLRPWREALLDPGSTGGMLDALAKGRLSGPVQLSPRLERYVQRYRSSLGR